TSAATASNDGSSRSGNTYRFPGAPDPASSFTNARDTASPSRRWSQSQRTNHTRLGRAQNGTYLLRNLHPPTTFRGIVTVGRFVRYVPILRRHNNTLEYWY